MRTIARNIGLTVAGMVTATAAVVGTLAVAQPDSPAGPAPSDPIVRTEHDPQPTQTVTQRVTQPRATTTVTQKPAPPKPPVTIRVTKRPFGTNPGDCPQEDSCWADYDGKSDRWIIKKGEQPNRRPAGVDLLPKEVRERANRGEFDPKPQPKATTKATTATRNATNTEPADPPSQDDPNGPVEGGGLRQPVEPPRTEPPAPDIKLP